MTEQEVGQVLHKPGEIRPGNKGSRAAIGQAAAGRYLRVVYSPDPGADSVFVITAYDRQTVAGGPTTTTEEGEMKKPTKKSTSARARRPQFPAGWDEERVQALPNRRWPQPGQF